MQTNQTGTKTPAYPIAHRRAARRLLLATLVALPLTLAACSTQADQVPAPLPMPSVNTTSSSAAASESQAEASPAPTAPQLQEIEPPVPSDVALENSADGAEAYAYFLFQAWWYLINTHDIDWWDANIPDCEWKTQLASLAQEAIENGSVDSVALFYPMTHERVRNKDNHQEYRITLRAEVGAIERRDRLGNTSIIDEAANRELVLRVTHDGAQWEINGVVIRVVTEP